MEAKGFLNRPRVAGVLHSGSMGLLCSCSFMLGRRRLGRVVGITTKEQLYAIDSTYRGALFQNHSHSLTMIRIPVTRCKTHRELTST